MILTEKQKEIQNLVASLYHDEQGNPIMLKQGQIEIFDAISKRRYPRNHCMCFTRYGKSLVVALAVLTRVSSYPEKWVIVGGNKEKAKIIMGYINAHIFDNEYIASRFRMEKGDSAEAIRRHRNKNHITFDVGNGLMGEVFIASAKDAIGLGSKNVVADESSLVPNDDWSLVMRMLGDDASDSFLFKIGNPFNRNHFLDSSLNPDYHQINIDAHKGVEEGRMTPQFLEEMRKFSFFKILYENKFPSADEVDEEGWQYLLTEDDITKAKARWATMEKIGIKRLGNDIARGGRNYNVRCLRGDNYATIISKDLESDLMKVAGTNIALMQEHKVRDGWIMLDDTGVGGGVTDRMREEGYTPVDVQLGAKATELVKKYNPKTNREEEMPAYANMRAQLYAGQTGLQHWIKYHGALDPEQDWSQLIRIRYKKNSSGLIMIESKEDARKRGEESPDEADAIMLTFAEPKAANFAMNTGNGFGGVGW